MPIIGEVFEKRLPRGTTWDEQAFQFCGFRGMGDGETHISSIFVDCNFDGCDLYLVLFNIATFVGVTFKNCTFRGCSFPGCRIVECKFENCRFTVDSFGGDCRFEDSRWYGCSQSETFGLSPLLATPIEGSGKKKGVKKGR